MKRFCIASFLLLASIASFSQEDIRLKKKDLKRDVELITSMGSIVVRLSDSTPLHRDNFLKLVKQGYYDSVLFHRVTSFILCREELLVTEEWIHWKPPG
jgi:hypothetical protein